MYEQQVWEVVGGGDRPILSGVTYDEACIYRALHPAYRVELMAGCEKRSS